MSKINIDNKHGVPTVSSLQVAEHFDKRHCHVIDAVKDLLNQPTEISVRCQNHFFESTYIDKKGEKRKCYEMTRDGFMLLAMGFNGKKALQWKLNYIEAFNRMEEQLRQIPLLTYRKEAGRIAETQTPVYVQVNVTLNEHSSKKTAKKAQSDIDISCNFENFAHSDAKKTVFQNHSQKGDDSMTEETVFTCHIDTVHFTRKPVGGEIGGIKNRLHENHGKLLQQRTTIESLSMAIQNGCTVQPCCTYNEDDLTSPSLDKDGNQKHDRNGNPIYKQKYTFISQQLILADIDNEGKDKKRLPDGEYMTLDRIGELLQENDLSGAIVYHSFSSKPEWEKFRVGILLDKPLTDKAERDKCVLAVFKLFGMATDEKCTNIDRIFFGSTPNSILYNEGCTVSKQVLLQLYDKLFPQSEPMQQPLPWNHSSLSPTFSNHSANIDTRFSTNFDPNVLLSMIDPCKLSYSEWITVSASYKTYEAGGQSLDFWLQWCSSYPNDDRRADTNTWNGLTGKGITKGTLIQVAKMHSPQQFDDYKQAMTPYQKQFPQNKGYDNTTIPNEPPKPIHYAVECLDDVQTEEQHYLWYPYLPIGEITVMFASGGTGKSFATVGIMSDITTGRTLPRDGIAPSMTTPERVLCISAEDSASIIKSRVREAGGNPKNIFVLKTPKSRKDLDSDSFLLPQSKDDVERINALCEILDTIKPKLLIIDPWSVYIGEGKNMNKMNEIRAVTNILTVIAKEYHCCILVVAHVNKMLQTENANNAVSGSTALIDACRSALCVRSFGATSDRRVIIQTKSNYALKGKSVCYRIINQGENQTAKFQWDGFIDLTADDLTDSARTGKKLTDIADEKEDESENIKIIVDVITSLAENFKKIPISYNRLRTEIADYCGNDFLGGHPQKCITKAFSDLRSCGIGIEFSKTPIYCILKDGSRSKKTERGFYICCLTDGHLMADAMPK